MRLLLAIGIALSAHLSPPARCQNATAAKPPEKAFSIEVIRTDVPEAGVFHRPIVTVGTNQFHFTAPRGFRIRPDEAQRKVYLEEPEGGCSITLRLRPDLAPLLKAPPAKPVNVTPGLAVATNAPAPTLHDIFRESLLKLYGNARITEEYEITAGGVSGAAYDLDWATPTGIRLHTRICYVPTAAGVFEFVLLVNPSQLDQFHGAFNSVLLTFRLAPPVEKGKKLELPEIPSQS